MAVCGFLRPAPAAEAAGVPWDAAAHEPGRALAAGRGQGSRLGIAAPARLRGRAGRGWQPNRGSKTCPSVLPGALQVLLVPEQQDLRPAWAPEPSSPLPVSAVSEHPGNGRVTLLVCFGDWAMLPRRGEGFVLYGRSAGRDWEVVQEWRAWRHWEGLGGGGEGLDGPAAVLPWGMQQGTQVKSLFQPLLHVEAEPGAGLSPAGFLCIAVHSQQRVPDVAAQSSVGNPDLALDVTGNRKAGAQTRPARHRGCESQPCSNSTRSKAAVGKELRGMSGTGTRSSQRVALSKSCV